MVTLNLKGDPIQSSWEAVEGGSHREESRWRFAARPRLWSPPTDVYETEGMFVVRVEIAGLQNGECSVSLDLLPNMRQLLLISGLRPDDQLERRAYHQMEIPFGEFRVEIELPFAVVKEEIEARYQDGFLHVCLPKAPADEPAPRTSADDDVRES